MTELLSKLHFQSEYRTRLCDAMEEFYLPAIEASTQYDRAVGYFRSSVFLLSWRAVLEFARRGGQIRLICSVDLDPSDIETLSTSVTVASLVSHELRREIDRLVKSEHVVPTRVLSTLIKVGALDIRVAAMADNRGIYHEKIGIFCDGSGESISFIGSSNETISAWSMSGNLESIEVFCSWRSASDGERIKNHKRHFNALWNNELAAVDTFTLDEAAQTNILRHSYVDLDEAERQLQREKRGIPVSNNKPLFKHQKEAVDAWSKAGRRGILEHATGSGKTVTAISCIREHFRLGHPAIVLVPSKLLIDQWANEIESLLPEVSILRVTGSNAKWKTSLAAFTSSDSSLGPRLVLSTMQSASKRAFINRVSQGDHLMLVADEVHQLGSPANSSVTNLATGPRLGLSATPARYGDEVGTGIIYGYFGGVIEPPFTLQDAITSGRLVQYEYFPHPVYLTAEETEEWAFLSKQIGVEFAKSKAENNTANASVKRLKLLLIRRARIAKKASVKIRTAVDILVEQVERDDRWLVYCEDQEQVRTLIRALTSKGLRPLEYHTSMEGDMAAALTWFKDNGGILVSIRCLDEGVDIPSISHALIIASSQNPRQFIQRRGRVLRRHPDKYFARIHDLVVLPAKSSGEGEPDSYFASEIARAVEFARSAFNSAAASKLEAIAIDLGLPIKDVYGIEDEEGCDE